MIQKSALKQAIREVFEEHEVEDGSLEGDLIDRIGQMVDVVDDDEEEEVEQG